MITFVAKSMFFDRQKVLSAVHRAKVRVLSRGGAYIRQTARTSMRYRKGPSKADGKSPPSAHRESGAFLRNKLFFGYDRRTDSVVVGPELLNGASRFGGTVPETLEIGGSVRVREVRQRGLWVRAGLVPPATRAGLATRTRTAKIAPRPYMGPALKANLPKLSGLWANSIAG